MIVRSNLDPRTLNCRAPGLPVLTLMPACVSLTWNVPDQRWQASVFADNVTDEDYMLQSFDLSGPIVFGMTAQHYGGPRWWGGSMRYQW